MNASLRICRYQTSVYRPSWSCLISSIWFWKDALVLTMTIFPPSNMVANHLRYLSWKILQLSFCIFAAIIIWDGTAVIFLAWKSYKETWRLHLRTYIYVCSYMLIACVSLCMDNQILLSLTCLFSMQALDISSCQNISHLGLSSIVSSAEGLQQLTLAHGSSVRIWSVLIFKH